MRILALECSTDVGSVALLGAGQVLWEHAWGASARGRQAWVADLDQWVRSGRIPLDSVELLAVGVGPGAFSGLRMAIALMQGLALPARLPLRGVSSGAALAGRIGRDLGAAEVVVAGDARRDELWLGRFRCEGAGPVQVSAWSVGPGDRLPADYAASGAVWVSADWHRIGARLAAVCPPGSRVIEERRVPEARDVGLLAGSEWTAGQAALPLVPLYLHPAVFVQPREAAARQEEQRT